MTLFIQGVRPAASGVPRDAQVLAFLALLPAVAAAVAMWLMTAPAAVEAVLDMLRAYAAIALGFLGGVRWGLAVGRITGAGRPDHGATGSTRSSNRLEADAGARAQFALSCMPPAVGWLALLPGPLAGLGLLICAFAVQCLWDVLSAGRGTMPEWYAGLRLFVTGIVVACLLAALLRLLVW